MDNLARLKEIDSFMKFFPNLKSDDDFKASNHANKHYKMMKANQNTNKALTMNEINLKIKEKVGNFDKIRSGKDKNNKKRRNRGEI